MENYTGVPKSDPDENGHKDLELMVLAEEGTPQSSDSILQRNEKEELGLLARPPLCCDSRCRPGNCSWLRKLPKYVIRSMSHVLFGTKLNWLLLSVPFAIVGAQGVFGHVSTMKSVS